MTQWPDPLSPRAIAAGLIVAILGAVVAGLILKYLDSDSNSTNSRPAPQLSQSRAPIPQNNETSKPEPHQTVNATTEKLPTLTGNRSNTTNLNSSSMPRELTGRWQGQWSSPFGTIFSANMYLEAIGTSNGIQGYINWNMKSTPQESKQTKIGLTAVEYVKGSYNSETRMLTMEGYREDDPNDIISLDKYRLVLAEDNRLGGATWNHGGWRGRLSLSR